MRMFHRSSGPCVSQRVRLLGVLLVWLCALPPLAVAAEGVKWHPGHYVTLQEQASSADHVGDVLTELRAIPAVKGIQVRYLWSELEPTRDHYDFSRVERDLRLAQAQGKRLFMLLQPKSFDPRRPSLPAYLVADGGGFEYGEVRGPQSPGKQNVALWTPVATERMQALARALGARFDGEPYFEGVAITESWFGKSRTPITPEMQQRFFENLLRVHRALREAFPRTVTLQFVNYPRQVLPWFVDGLASMGAGLGGPDVFPDDPGLNKGIYTYYPKLAGKIPLAPSVQNQNYRTTRHGAKDNPPALEDLFGFARDRLNANYLFWTRNVEPPRRPYEQLLSLLRSERWDSGSAGGLSSGCPSAFASCSN